MSSCKRLKLSEMKDKTHTHTSTLGLRDIYKMQCNCNWRKHYLMLSLSLDKGPFTAFVVQHEKAYDTVQPSYQHIRMYHICAEHITM